MNRNFWLALTLAGATACAGGDDAADTETLSEDSIAADGTTPGAETNAAASGAFIDPDNATRDQLIAAGLDAATADALVAARPFPDMRAVDAVLAGSMSEAERDSVYTRVWKPLDLNSASAEEIMLIPGVGERMKHEFEEYRPYSSMDEFRREIGKYVDDAEVARLEQYVTIR